MASMMSNFEDVDRSPDSSSHRKKRRRIDTNTHQPSSSNNTINNDKHTPQLRWRSPAEQRTYSSKLIEALRHVRRRNTNTNTAPLSPPISGSRAVRDAADKALAIAAKGRTRWSRAILTNRMKLRLKNHKKAKVRSKVPSLPPLHPGGASRGSGEKVPGVEKRVKVLGRLVPGCKKLSFPNLLEEATDYIAALQMQVRTMAALAELLSGSTPAGLMDVEPGISTDGDRDNPVQ